jgi:hypothetical protein
MMRKATLILSMLAVIVAAVWMFQANTPETVKATDDPQALNTGEAGMKAYIDPVTGEFLQEPPQPLVTEAVKDINDPLSTSSEGLKQVPAPVGGGVMVDLKGRFQQTITATVDDSGKVTAICDRHDSDETTTSDSEKE